MPDWQELVRLRLGNLALDPAEKDEVHAELAAHLEEVYEGFVQKGFFEDEAVQFTQSQVQDWQQLQRKIQIARREGNNLTNRVRQLWLPGFLTLFMSESLLMLIQLFGPHSQIANPKGWSMIAAVILGYAPWLLTLPVIGAIGALLSNRAGASQRLVLVSILFPALPYLCFGLIGFPTALILEERFAHFILASSILVGLFVRVLVPGVALLAGGLATQFFLSRRLASGGVVGH